MKGEIGHTLRMFLERITDNYKRILLRVMDRVEQELLRHGREREKDNWCGGEGGILLARRKCGGWKWGKDRHGNWELGAATSLQVGGGRVGAGVFMGQKSCCGSCGHPRVAVIHQPPLLTRQWSQMAVPMVIGGAWFGLNAVVGVAGRDGAVLGQVATEVSDDAESPAETESGPEDPDLPLQRSTCVRPMWTWAKSVGEDASRFHFILFQDQGLKILVNCPTPVIAPPQFLKKPSQQQQWAPISHGVGSFFLPQKCNCSIVEKPGPTLPGSRNPSTLSYTMAVVHTGFLGRDSKEVSNLFDGRESLLGKETWTTKVGGVGGMEDSENQSFGFKQKITFFKAKKHAELGELRSAIANCRMYKVQGLKVIRKVWKPLAISRRGLYLQDHNTSKYNFHSYGRLGSWEIDWMEMRCGLILVFFFKNIETKLNFSCLRCCSGFRDPKSYTNLYLCNSYAKV
ncbi:hypothetical protein VP01_2670g2 [Puccinia sorghi]|uniref:Uncharacterized protein n=1 Tax=Puccinia sorghi TaxID=27349 RepID=A0A0L6V3X0_9BASI|nr:hypothetical protein VP01_2670g2 [Puccinia sorghi]